MELQTALDNLYKAARQLNTTADIHQALYESYNVLLAAIKPVEAPKDETL